MVWNRKGFFPDILTYVDFEEDVWSYSRRLVYFDDCRKLSWVIDHYGEPVRPESFRDQCESRNGGRSKWESI
jgi:hypothetical protein